VKPSEVERMGTVSETREAVLQELKKVLGSETFSGAGRSTTLLTFLVEQTLDDRSDRLKEYTLGADALGRGESFDPRTDPIVRAEASRLRARLERYYGSEGRADTVVITLPRGSYVPNSSFVRLRLARSRKSLKKVRQRALSPG
jgi:hypothetical protein